MSRVAGGVLRFLGILQIPEVGAPVRIQYSARNPLGGHTGTVVAVSSGDPYGAYLVEFENGLRFRYQLSELSVAHCHEAVQKRVSSLEG